MDDFGFGRELGMDIWGDSPGILPSTQWKKSIRGGAWFPEAVIAGIGRVIGSPPVQRPQAPCRLPRRVFGETGHGQIRLRPLNRLTGLRNLIPVRNPANWKRTVKAMEDVMHGALGLLVASNRGALSNRG